MQEGRHDLEPTQKRFLRPNEVRMLKAVVVDNQNLHEAAISLGISYPAVQTTMNRIRDRFGLNYRTDELRWELRVILGLEKRW